MAEILVAGGGAAGMSAALFAARNGASVTLLERNEKPGKKIYITGKGRCNLTNDCDQDAFLSQVPRNPRFLYSALRFFSPQDMMALLASAGCPVEVQRGRRVFPVSQKASDVTRALTGLLKAAGVRILLNARVSAISLSDGAVSGVALEDGRSLSAGAVVLATGGRSYPATGSTGDGYRLAAETGHRIVAPRPSLSALETADAWPLALQGLSLRNVSLSLTAVGKALYQELGEMLLTHFGVSGPLVLEASCHLPEDPAGAVLMLDWKPGLTREQLDARLLREFSAAGKKQLRNVLPALLPQRAADLFPELCGLPAALPCSQVTAAQRLKLLEMLKATPIPIRGFRPLEEAIVTRGGVDVRDIRPGTMESRLIPGLYFAGELIDVDAHTGGFNLRIAWSTGALAGKSAAEAFS